jgi:energy-coupling factor transporter transmembrane protein EcfT
MKWIVHPAKRNLNKTIVSAFFVTAFVVIVGVFYGIFWSIFGFIILFVSVQSYFFPTAYDVTEEEVIIKNIFMTQRRKLSEFRRVYVGRNGILLSPFRRKTFLNQFRGVFLLLPDQHEEIVSFLRERIEAGKTEKKESGDTN